MATMNRLQYMTDKQIRKRINWAKWILGKDGITPVKREKMELTLSECYSELDSRNPKVVLQRKDLTMESDRALKRMINYFNRKLKITYSIQKADEIRCRISDVDRELSKRRFLKENIHTLGL